ncbi:MAG: hypothetical protein Q7K98_05575 [Candidatus Omnitrophota bacterium]|nr:hypothetical protein [Candidatus Omnitrophota bacterium]
MKIKYEDAIKISNNFLQSKGFDTQKTETILDPKNEKWVKYYSNNKLLIEYYSELLKTLEDKNYWAIHYVPKKMTSIIKGGGAWVFIDVTTGKVISYFLEK